MSAHANLGLLCQRLVAEAYGSAAGELVGVLVARGRLTSRELSCRLKWPKSAVLRVLVSLTYSRIVRYSEETVDTYYTANLEAAYELLWAGPLAADCAKVSAVDPADAETATKMVRTLAVHSQLKVQDIAEIGQLEPASAQRALTAMVRLRVVVPIRQQDFISPEDRRLAAIAAGMTQLANPRDGLALSEAARKQSTAGFALQFDRDEETAKRTAHASLLAQLADGDGSSARETAVRINPQRFAIRRRSVALAELVNKRAGPISAKVYSVLLTLSERSVESLQAVRVPGPDTTVTASEIALNLQKTPDMPTAEELSAAFVQPGADQGIGNDLGEDLRVSSAKRLKTAGGLAVPMAGGSGGPGQLAGLVNQHLCTVEQCLSGAKLVLRCGDRGAGEWFVPFNEAAEALRRATFEELVSSMLGPVAQRLLRVVRQHGKIDEKTLPQVALVQQRDLRHHFYNLQHYGFVDLQEIPRGNDRSAGRQIYFWFHRPKRAYAEVVDALYTALLATYAENDVLRLEHQTLLSKMQREDVRAEPKLLTASEQEEYASFTAAETALAAERLLLDDYVRIFRDY